MRKKYFLLFIFLLVIIALRLVILRLKSQMLLQHTLSVSFKQYFYKLSIFIDYKMKKEKRYMQKIELIEERLTDVEEWVSDFSDKKQRLACYKAFQEMTEALFDVGAMAIKDKGKIVDDDYANLDKLKDLKIIDEKDVKILQEANGLRNRIIHRYNKTDDAIAQESMTNITGPLKNVLMKFKLKNESKSCKEDQK